MSTTTTYRPVTIDHLDRDGWDGDELLGGQSPSMAAVGFTSEQFEALYDAASDEYHPIVVAWEKVVDEVEAEIEPQIRDLFYEALSRRLPFRWEPEPIGGQ